MIGWLFGHLFQLACEYSEQHFLCPVGSDWFLLLPKQDIQLLMSITKILDTYALIAFFEDEPGADFVRSLLLEAESGSLNLAMCVVNLGE